MDTKPWLRWTPSLLYESPRMGIVGNPAFPAAKEKRLKATQHGSYRSGCGLWGPKTTTPLPAIVISELLAKLGQFSGGDWVAWLLIFGAVGFHQNSTWYQPVFTVMGLVTK